MQIKESLLETCKNSLYFAHLLKQLSNCDYICTMNKLQVLHPYDFIEVEYLYPLVLDPSIK